MKTVLLSSILAFSLSGCLMPSGINPSLGCSAVTGCTSEDYYIPAKGVWASKESFWSTDVTKAKIGAVSGVVIGAALGSGDPLLSAGGAVAGLVIGHEIGAHFDKVDQIYATLLLKKTLTTNGNGQMSTWENPNKGFSVTQGPVATNGNCREFISKVTVGQELRNVKGTACLENNEWIMKEIYQ